MTDFEYLICALLIPITFVLVYIAGRYDLLNLTIQMLAERCEEMKKKRNGEWVNPFINKYGHPCHCCSECGFEASQQDKNYCPNCGVKMDGGKQDGV